MQSRTPYSGSDENATPDHEPSGQLPDVDTRLRQLADELRVRGREIDELQAADKHRPWFRQATTLVAIGALVVSLLSAVGGFQLQSNAETRAALRERAQDRSDLRSILQRLIVLPLETQELYTDYPPETALELSRNVTSEYALLTGQAVKIIEQLGKTDNDDVSAAEYNALATAMLFTQGKQEQARAYFQSAIDRAKTLIDAVSAIRSIAQIDFQQGSYDAMREQYERALEATQSYPSTAFDVGVTNMETYLLCATFEVSIQRCVDAKALVERALEAATEGNVFARDATMKTRYDKMETTVSGCVTNQSAPATDG